MPDFAGLDKVGIAGVCIAILFFGYKFSQLFIAQWKQSTDAVNRNTKSFEKLANIFEKQSERELKFQQEVLNQLHNGNMIARDTNKKVNDIHGRLKIQLKVPKGETE